MQPNQHLNEIYVDIFNLQSQLARTSVFKYVLGINNSVLLQSDGLSELKRECRLVQVALVDWRALRQEDVRVLKVKDLWNCRPAGSVVRC